MDAERAFGEQQEREHPHRFGGPESSSGAKNGGINGSDGSGTRGSEGTKSQRSGRSKGSNASPRKEDLPGLVHRFRGANGEYNPYGQFFPAPPEPPRPPGFWPWMQSQELKTMSSPVPQYFARRVSHMNYKGWVEGPVDVEPKVVSLDLIEKGIHPLRIATGFEKACEVAVKKVEEIAKVIDIQADDRAALRKAASTALGSKVVSSRKDQLAKISVDAVLAMRHGRESRSLSCRGRSYSPRSGYARRAEPRRSYPRHSYPRRSYRRSYSRQSYSRRSYSPPRDYQERRSPCRRESRSCSRSRSRDSRAKRRSRRRRSQRTPKMPNGSAPFMPPMGSMPFPMMFPPLWSWAAMQAQSEMQGRAETNKRQERKRPARSRSASANPPGSCNDSVLVKRNLMGRVIGKGGSVIKGIRQDSGARVDAEDRDEDHCEFRINGTEEQVQRAKAMIREQVEKVGLERPLGDQIEAHPILAKKKHQKKDHYDILQISRSANLHDIRQAFRSRALATHPDRLVQRLKRQPSDEETKKAVESYQEVLEAFDLLSDQDARNIYDAQSGPPSGQADADADDAIAGDAGKERHEVDARFFLHNWISRWQEISLDQPSKTLICLRTLLTGGDDPPEDSRMTTEQLDPCMFARACGYEVQVTWSNFVVATPTTTSLSQAIAWRAALTALRHTAQRRQNGSKSERPLLQSELKMLLEMQPDIRVMFRFRVNLQKVQVQTASSKKAASKKKKPSARTGTVAKLTLFTPRLELAVEMKNSLLKVQSKREFDKLMEQHKNTIAWEKKKAKSYLDKLLPEINKTLFSRLICAEEQALPRSEKRGSTGTGAGAPSQKFCDTLGLTTSSAINRAVTTLQEVPIQERSRRLKVLLAKPRALTAPPLKVQRAIQRPEGPRRASGKSRWTCTVLPQETMAMIIALLPFFDLAKCRAASKSLLSMSRDSLWLRCRRISCPMEPTFLGGFKKYRTGRIYYRTSVLDMSIRFLQQPEIMCTVEQLNLENMSGKDVAERLHRCLKEMKHLQEVVLPSTGWCDHKTLLRLKNLLSQRGINHSIAKIR
eukprot:symbB.v1.2.020026.t2/scaffold1663.1/size106897/6